MSKKSMKFKTAGKSGDILNYLEKLVDSIKKGTVYLQKEEDSITLKPRGNINFELSAAQKDDKEKIEIELSWLVEEDDSEENVDFKISAQAPELEEESVKEKPAEKEELPVEEKKTDIEVETQEEASKLKTGTGMPKAKTTATKAKS